jgi:HSP20 family protein
MSTIVRWNPTLGLRPSRRVRPGYFGAMAPYWDSRVALPLDIEENEGNFVIKASVPGFAPEDINVEVEDGILTIRAEHSGEEEQEREDWFVRERYSGSVERKLRLGKSVDAESIEAELQHGVLTLTLAKAEEAKPRLIEVKATN